MPTPSRCRRSSPTRSTRARPRLGPLGVARAVSSRRSARPTTSRRRWRVAAIAEGAVVVADAQTAGRGRRGRTLVFAAGQRALRVGRARARPRARRSGARDDAADAGGRRRARRRRSTRRPACASTSSGRTICSSAGASSPAFWPKASASDRASVVLGYGINVGRAAYPPELRDRATSLESELGRPRRSRAAVRRDARRARRAATTTCSTAGSMLFSTPGAAARRRSRRRARDVGHGRRHRSHGVTAGIDDQGALLVRVGDRVERIVARRSCTLGLT